MDNSVDKGTCQQADDHNWLGGVENQLSQVSCWPQNECPAIQKSKCNLKFLIIKTFFYNKHSQGDHFPFSCPFLSLLRSLPSAGTIGMCYLPGLSYEMLGTDPGLCAWQARSLRDEPHPQPQIENLIHSNLKDRV